MKLLFSVLFVFTYSMSLSAQELKPVKWTYEVVHKKDHIYEIHFTARMDKKWAIYSQYTNDEGPVPTKFSFRANKDLRFEKGVIEAGEMISGYDELFETTVKKFKVSVDFIQTVQLLANETKLDGHITFMTCDDIRCLPPVDEIFSIQIP